MADWIFILFGLCWWYWAIFIRKPSTPKSEKQNLLERTKREAEQAQRGRENEEIANWFQFYDKSELNQEDEKHHDGHHHRD